MPGQGRSDTDPVDTNFGNKWSDVIESSIQKYCSKSPNITSKAIKCQIWAETEGNQNKITHAQEINQGLLQISEEIWNKNCADIGSFDKNWAAPEANIQCGIKLLCEYFKGNISNENNGYGTHTNKYSPYWCCMNC